MPVEGRIIPARLFVTLQTNRVAELSSNMSNYPEKPDFCSGFQQKMPEN